MDGEEEKLDWKRLVITVALVVLGSVITASVTWFFLDRLVNESTSANDRLVQQLESKIAYLQKQDQENDGAVSVTDSLKPSDKETLTILAVRQANFSNIAVSSAYVKGISGDWAIVSPVPVNFTTEKGYEIVGMGGQTYLYQKKNGVWTYVGVKNEGGWDSAAKTVFPSVPKDLIPDSDRS